MKTLLPALAVCFAMPAWAQSCFPYPDIRSNLEQKYGEHVHIRGMTSNGAVLEVYLNEETGTWSAIIVRPDGLACPAASGEFGEVVDEALRPAGQRL